MPSVCFTLEVHQPYRLDSYRFFDIGVKDDYEDEVRNRELMLKAAKRCYLPMNELLLELIEHHQGRFRCSFAMTGTFAEQCAKYAPEVLESFRKLAKTGCVEFLGQTDTHTLAAVFSEDDFRAQVKRHSERMKDLFDQAPRAFRNTELVYSNRIARLAEEMGFSAILAESPDQVLDWRSPNFVYHAEDCHDMKLMLKSRSLSDDITFRFTDGSWAGYPLMAETYAGWLHDVKHNGDVVNLCMDYETFGEYLRAETGIFDFMRALPGLVLDDPDFDFLTVSEAAARYPVRDWLNIPYCVSWADGSGTHELAAWAGNDMQKDTLRALYDCKPLVEEAGDPALTKAWHLLQAADHFRCMDTRPAAEDGARKYAYATPMEAYSNFMNILADFRIRLLAAISR